MLPFNLKGREEGKKTNPFFLVIKVTEGGGRSMAVPKPGADLCVGPVRVTGGESPRNLSAWGTEEPLGKNSNLRQRAQT